MSLVKKIVESTSEEVRTTMKILCDDTRYAIVLTLLKNGEMSFSKLKETLGISSNVLSHHLKVLIQAALVKNYYAKRVGSDEYSYYDTTLLSRDFVDNLFRTIEPKPPMSELLNRFIIAGQKYPKTIVNLVKNLQDYGKPKAGPKAPFIRRRIMEELPAR